MVEDMGDFGTGVTPPPPPGEQPAPSRARSRARGAAAGIGVALVVGAGGIAVANSGSAATSSPGAAPTSEGAPTPAPQQGLPGGGAGKFRGGPGRVGGVGGVLHGTFVVSKSGGGYQTVQVQTGTVDSVSSTSLAVTSKDGWKFTYVVKAGTNVNAQRDGIASIKKGDEVVVNATLSGKTGTVDRITDKTELAKNPPTFSGGEGGFMRGPGKGAPPSVPANPGTGT
ncbi:MAG: hypothetical protein QOE24_2573 [Frankiales bacterium]|jgi:hypothetical protein|nr:hypothetical protein [Frankiales bacterium]